MRYANNHWRGKPFFVCFAKVAGIPGIPGNRGCRTVERTYYSDTHCLQTSLSIFKLTNHTTKESFVSNLLMTIDDVKVSIAIHPIKQLHYDLEISIACVRIM